MIFLSEMAQLRGATNGTDSTPMHAGNNGLVVVVWLAGMGMLFYGLHRCADYHSHPNLYHNDDGSKRWYQIFCGRDRLYPPATVEVTATAGGYRPPPVSLGR